VHLIAEDSWAKRSLMITAEGNSCFVDPFFALAPGATYLVFRPALLLRREKKVHLIGSPSRQLATGGYDLFHSGRATV